MVIIQENNTCVDVGKTQEKISKKLEVFYNPLMKFNRDCSIILLNASDMKNISIGSPLAGSGIRELRMIKELKPGIIKEIHVNDLKPDFKEMIVRNIELNHLNHLEDNIEKIIIHNTEANIFLLNSSGFEYIDIDPFGCPNKFLDAAIRRIARSGILAVTATDTSALAGTYPLATARKYYAKPMRNHLMHEIGIRLLVRKVQLIGAQYDKAFLPVFSYSKDHYYRIFFRCEKGKSKVDKMLALHKYFMFCESCHSFKVSESNKDQCRICKKDMIYAGPLWTGMLFDRAIIKQMKKERYAETIADKENIKFFEALCDEALSNTNNENYKDETCVGHAGFYELPDFMKLHKIKRSMKLNDVIEALKRKGFRAARTHFGKQGIKTDASSQDLVNIFSD